MITRCCFCDYHKSTPINRERLLKAYQEMVVHNGFPTREMLRFLMDEPGHLKDWNGVKVHMGIKHKTETYEGIWPRSEWEPEELAALEEAAG